MTPLATVAERVDCIVAAWVDIRTGAVIAQHAASDDAFIAPALEAAIEIMRSAERPPRMVLLSEHHVHIVHRNANDPYRVLVVICRRSPNLGLAVSLVRGLMEAEAA
jgi:hypothetical protein